MDVSVCLKDKKEEIIQLNLEQNHMKDDCPVRHALAQVGTISTLYCIRN